jgi:hypothetical protein
MAYDEETMSHKDYQQGFDDGREILFDEEELKKLKAQPVEDTAKTLDRTDQLIEWLHIVNQFECSLIQVIHDSTHIAPIVAHRATKILFEFQYDRNNTRNELERIFKESDVEP